MLYTPILVLEYNSCKNNRHQKHTHWKQHYITLQRRGGEAGGPVFPWESLVVICCFWPISWFRHNWGRKENLDFLNILQKWNPHSTVNDMTSLHEAQATEPVKNRGWIQTQIRPVQTLCCTMWHIWFCHKLILFHFYECRLLISPQAVCRQSPHDPDNQDGANTPDVTAGAKPLRLHITLWARAPVLKTLVLKHTLSLPFCALTTPLTLIQHPQQARKVHEPNLQVPCALVRTDIALLEVVKSVSEAIFNKLTEH